MILYVNGDSHSVGHSVVQEMGMAHEDLRYAAIKYAPHPDNLPSSYGYLIAEKLDWPLVCQGFSGGSADRCIRVTRQFLFQTYKKVFVLIGWPSFDREEWYFQNRWWPITKGDADRYPTELHTKFKNWLVNFDLPDVRARRVKYITKQIDDFHLWLTDQQIPHLFFNTVDQQPNVDTYRDWLINNHIQPDQWDHFRADGHTAWAEYLTPKIYDIIR